MIITIDGPAGSGKSTVARKLAARLEIAYLDTGAMYRAIAYAGLQQGVDFEDSNELVLLVDSIHLELDCGPTFSRVRINGHDVTEAIRTLDVSAATSSAARHGAVREKLVAQQRRMGNELGSLVAEGRDQGSVVFPDADAKFVLDATIAKRAQRRYDEMRADGQDVTLEQTHENLCARDRVDTIQWQPLLSAAGTILIDTTEMTISEVIEAIVSRLPRRLIANDVARDPNA